MTFDEGLAQRIREALADERGVEEKRMFGGLAFMVDGHMACGVVDSDLMIRLGEKGAAAALSEEHVRPMDFTGRPLRTMAYVGADGVAEDEDLAAWVQRAVKHARSLPPK